MCQGLIWLTPLLSTVSQIAILYIAMHNITTHTQAPFYAKSGLLTLFQLVESRDVDNSPATGSLVSRPSQLLVRMPNWPTYTSKNGTGSLIARSTVPLFHSTVPPEFIQLSILWLKSVAKVKWLG